MTEYRQAIDENMTFSLDRWHQAGRWIFFAMLLTLHLALWAGVYSVWSRPLLFAHLGLFLMWQPLWRGEENLRAGSVLIILGVSALAMFWLSWWLLAFWVSGLFSLVGGRVFAFQSKWQRRQYLLAMAYLLAVQLFWLTPQLFLLPTTAEAAKGLMEYALPMLLSVLVFIPHERTRLQKTEVIDLIYSMLLFMLLAMLVLGALAFMRLGRVDYFDALLRTLFSMALVLFVLGWLWNPRLGFAGFQVFFSRYFLNIGSPFELWLQQLARLSQQDDEPEVFLRQAMGHLAELTWLSGVSWCDGAITGELGARSKHEIRWMDRDLEVVIYARQRLTPAVLMHNHLFFQILAHFYHAKRHEQRLRELVRLQTVNEMGARLTHELKNMLQSLLALIEVAEQQPIQAQALLHRQLPILARQIEVTLGKLKIPRHTAETGLVPLALWWGNLQQRHQYSDLQWIAGEELAATRIPGKLFDSVADNLIENVRNKRQREPGISAQIMLQMQPLGFSVCDSGSAIPVRLAGRLMQTVVDSEDGLGVGLFQAARWAEQLGYQLRLTHNIEGRVCFELNFLNN